MMPGLAAAAVIFLRCYRRSPADGWAAPPAPDVPPHEGERLSAGLAGGNPVQSTSTLLLADCLMSVWWPSSHP